MAYGDIGAVIETLEFDAGTGIDVWGIHVFGDIYVAAYQGPSSFLWLTTFSIDSDGVISDAVIATDDFSPSWGVLPHIIKVADNIFAVVYQGTGYHGTIKTIAIEDDGTIGAEIDDHVFNAADTRAPKIVHVAEDIFAISYINTGDTTIKVETLKINAAGGITALDKTIDLTDKGQYFTNIVAVSSTIFAVQYAVSANGVGTWVATIEIDELGDITAKDTQLIDATINALRMSMCEALDGVFAIAHVGADNDGFVSTVTIDAAGEISTVVDTQEIWLADATEFCILHIGEGICAITFKNTAGPDGWIVTVSIDAAGDNIDVIDAGVDFETTTYVDGMVLQIDGDTYAVFFGGPGNDGFVVSLDISTPPEPPAEASHHEMIMGVGP